LEKNTNLQHRFRFYMAFDKCEKHKCQKQPEIFCHLVGNARFSSTRRTSYKCWSCINRYRFSQCNRLWCISSRLDMEAIVEYFYSSKRSRSNTRICCVFRTDIVDSILTVELVENLGILPGYLLKGLRPTWSKHHYYNHCYN